MSLTKGREPVPRFLVPVRILVIPAVIFFYFSFASLSQPAAPALLQGLVSNLAGNAPVVGATVLVNGMTTLTVSGGVYTILIDPPGAYPVQCTKPGFEDYTSQPVVFQPGATVTLNIGLSETLYPPADATASLDSSAPAVHIFWSPPAGSYELLYDDGIQDNFTTWSTPGNMNAVKFTPAGFPFQVTGGKIHIGAAGNYPPGSNPLIPFQVTIFDASGTGGTPGVSLAGPFQVMPAALGWVGFILPEPVVITGGSFFIAMVQGGSAPNAAGMAIDETTPRYRSYSRFVTGGGGWFPAGGNFMVRAMCNGPGGPFLLTDSPMPAGEYRIFRLRQGEEQNPAVWTSVGTTSACTFTDPSWPALPCGPYRWGVQAHYPGNRWSGPAFSNVLGKCWTATVNLHADLSCNSADPAGISVRLENLALPDTVYAAYAGSTGSVVFPKVWKGNYRLTVAKFGYDTLVQTVPVITPQTLSLFLMQEKTPPENLRVNDTTLEARWDVPDLAMQILFENWNSGSLNTGGWTVEGSYTWSVTASFGNPSPSAMFSGSPRQTGYSRSLTSRLLTGQNSTLLELKYDLLLENTGSAALNQLFIEIWNGAAWTTVKTYTAMGNIPWKKEEIDISEYTNKKFMIRFRAAGEDSQEIVRWLIDNVEIVASEPAQAIADCILGYYFYLGNAIVGYTPVNAFQVPGNLVQYGQSCEACVRALYGSGYSGFSCTSFTSLFLYPATGLHGSPVDNAAYIAWNMPAAPSGNSFVTPPGLIGYNVYRNGSLVATVPHPDTLAYYDLGLEPGVYHYTVKARYDLVWYGFPGTYGESPPAGPLDMSVTWGFQLPFLEPWDQGSFYFNEWRFTPSQGNWTIDQAEGTPPPSAGFTWQPPLVDYDFSLESPPFNGLPYNCAAIWLDFDLKLEDRNATGTEKLFVEAYYNNTWHRKAEVVNNGNSGWIRRHVDISPVHGKGFRIRFLASGLNSNDIRGWNLDNIHIYPLCYPASDLAGESYGDGVILTWSPPECYGGNLLDEGFEPPLFPPQQWVVQTTNPAATWSHIFYDTPPGVHAGNFSAGLNWDYNHQDEWLIATDTYVNGDLKFWSYAFQGSLHQDHYYVKISADQGASWAVVLDMSALPLYGSSTGVNAWETPYVVDLSMYDGETVDIAWHAVDGDGNGLWYPWAIDDCTVGSGKRLELSGYDLYRKGSGDNAFGKINAGPVTDTTYHDAGLATGQYQYFISPVFAECDSIQHSDTVSIDVITGAGTLFRSKTRVFPNPATDHFTIISAAGIDEVLLYDATGRVIGKWQVNGSCEVTIPAGDIEPGLYFLAVVSGRESVKFKVSVTTAY